MSAEKLRGLWKTIAVCVTEVLEVAIDVVPEAWGEPGGKHEHVRATMAVAKQVSASVAAPANNGTTRNVSKARVHILKLAKPAKDAAKKGERGKM